MARQPPALRCRPSPDPEPTRETRPLYWSGRKCARVAARSSLDKATGAGVWSARRKRRGSQRRFRARRRKGSEHAKPRRNPTPSSVVWPAPAFTFPDNHPLASATHEINAPAAATSRAPPRRSLPPLVLPSRPSFALTHLCCLVFGAFASSTMASANARSKTSSNALRFLFLLASRAAAAPLTWKIYSSPSPAGGNRPAT